MVSWNPIRAAVVVCAVFAVSSSHVSHCNAAPVVALAEPAVAAATLDAFPIDISPLIQKLQDATNKINNAVPGSLVASVDLEAQRTHFQEMFNAVQSKLQAMSQDGNIPELQRLQQQLQAFDEAVMKATNVNGGAQATPLTKREPFRGGRWSGRIGTLADVLDIFSSGCQLAGFC
ncbi:hypothetical protein HK102_000588 [Quaeritorhiza haematococci]|nr:hypothetical protein HK102_000588 [Quaeritorhiza haematococci]